MSPVEKPNKNISKFLIVACTCFIVYLASCIVKNLLSVNSTFMIREGYSSVTLGVMSSVYLVVHGATQILVSFIGDKVKLKYMVLLGAGSAGVCCYLFAAVDNIIVQTVLWGVCGFGLSFIYAPLAKSIADHLDGKQAEISMALLDIAATLGGTVAGLFGTMGDWKMSMVIMASVLVFVAAATFTVYFFFDRRHLLLKRTEGGGKADMMPLKQFLGYWMKHGAVAFILICCLQGIAANTIAFWIPTYLSEYLKFSPKVASILFSVISLVSATNEFIALALYHLMKEKMMWVIRFSFLLSAVGFVLLIFIPNPYANVTVLLLAKCAYGWVGPIIWAFYCRSFKNVNRVVFVISILNCVGYFASALSSYLFSEAIANVGWIPLIIIWAAMMLSGCIFALFYRDKKEPAATAETTEETGNAVNAGNAEAAEGTEEAGAAVNAEAMEEIAAEGTENAEEAESAPSPSEAENAEEAGKKPSE